MVTFGRFQTGKSPEGEARWAIDASRGCMATCVDPHSTSTPQRGNAPDLSKHSQRTADFPDKVSWTRSEEDWRLPKTDAALTSAVSVNIFDIGKQRKKSHVIKKNLILAMNSMQDYVVAYESRILFCIYTFLT